MRDATDLHSARGANVRFRITPTVTALAGFEGPTESPTLNAESVLDDLSADFARGVQDLATVLADLKRLSTYGALPIQWETGGWISVRFPGCDARQAEGLCDEAGVRRGYVIEDEGWIVDYENDLMGDKDVRMALLFPFAPSQPTSSTGSVADMFCSPDLPKAYTGLDGSSPAFSTRSLTSADGFDDVLAEEHNVWVQGYETGSGTLSPPTVASREGKTGGSGYEGVEGIYRFLAECDLARR